MTPRDRIVEAMGDVVSSRHSVLRELRLGNAAEAVAELQRMKRQVEAAIKAGKEIGRDRP